MGSRIAYAALTLSLAGIAWIAPAPARACSCMQAPPPREAAEAATAVFQGQVTALDVEQPEGSYITFHVYTFAVERTWKGDTAPALTIRTTDNSAACGRSFEIGASYLVYAGETDGQLSDNLCSRTRPVAEAGDDFAALGPAIGEADSPPRPAEPEPPRAEPSGDGPSPPAPSPSARGCVVTSTVPDPAAAASLVLWMACLGSRRRKRG